MLVKGTGGNQYTVFCPNETLQQQQAIARLREWLVRFYGGVTEVPMQGYWNPPNKTYPDHLKVETGRVIVVITDGSMHADKQVRALFEGYAKDSGEEQVLFTRNNLDIFYVNKEQV